MDQGGAGGEVKMTRQGVRVLRPTRPAGPRDHLAEPSCDSPTRDDDWTLHLGTLRRFDPANSGKARYSPGGNRDTLARDVVLVLVPDLRQE